MVARGIRNNNPLNIRKSDNAWKGKIEGTDPEFETFIGMEYGFRAAFLNIRTYITKYHWNTIEQIVSHWAPASENNTQGYIASVCRMTGLGGREVIAWPALSPLPPSPTGAGGGIAQGKTGARGELKNRWPEKLKAIVWAMAQVECGKGILKYREELERGWEMAGEN